MLILTRKIGETLVLGEDAFFTVLGIKGGQVRIGICAPKDVAVHREEIFIKVKAEKEALNAENSDLDISLIDAFRMHQQTSAACHTH